MATPRKDPKDYLKMGRPTKYKPEFVAMVDEYLADCEDEYTEFHKTRGDKSDSYDRLIKVNLPSLVGFSLRINVDETTMWEWAKIYPDFSKALDKIKKIQQERLVKGGLSGEYNPMIAKLVLSANHGMREKSDITSDDKAIMAPISGMKISKDD